VDRRYFKNPNLNRLVSTVYKVNVEHHGRIIIFGDAAIINFTKVLPDIIFFHHANPLEHPENYSLFVRAALFWTIKKIEQCDATIVVLSEYTKKLLLKFTHIARERIRVVYPYVDIPPPDKIVETVKKQYNPLSRPLILAVGTSIKFKNFSTLYKAVEGTKMQVVRVGGNEEYERALYSIPNNVKFAGSLDLGLDQIAALYEISDVLAFTSTDEGFGFPLIEAMHFGLPKVGNTCTTVPEIVVDAGILISDPYNYLDLRNALCDKLRDHEYYRKKVQMRSQLFSKDRYIQQMSEIIGSHKK
jgi:glycosyltransferase involved in cell wall biosynthesis